MLSWTLTVSWPVDIMPNGMVLIGEPTFRQRDVTEITKPERARGGKRGRS